MHQVRLGGIFFPVANFFHIIDYYHIPAEVEVFFEPIYIYRELRLIVFFPVPLKTIIVGFHSLHFRFF